MKISQIRKKYKLGKQKKTRKSTFSRLFPVFGDFSSQTIKRPTLTFMTDSEVRTFNKPGLKISLAVKVKPGHSIPTILQKVIQESPEKTIPLLVRPHRPISILLKKEIAISAMERKTLVRTSRGFGGGLIRGIDAPVRASSGSSGSSGGFPQYPSFENSIGKSSRNIVIVVPVPEETDVEVTVKVRKNGDVERINKIVSPKKKKVNKILKESYNDTLLIEALKTADKELFEGKHKGILIWKEDGEYHEKDFHNAYILVCLFLFIYFKKLYADGDFYKNKLAFYNYCFKGLCNDGEDSLKLMSYNYFCQNIKDLQVRKERFEDYVKAEKKFTPLYEKGKANLLFWYEMYCKATCIFERFFSQSR